MPTHAEAREDVRQGYVRDYGTEPSAAEVEALTAVGSHETGYGTGWKDPGKGSHNWGAVQCGTPDKDTGECPAGKCPAGSFHYTDTHPEANGTNTTYSVCFKGYADDVAGAADMIKYVGKKATDALASNPSFAAFALAMYQNHYFEGADATATQQAEWGDLITYIQSLDTSLTAQRAGRVAGYAIGLDGSAQSAANALGVPRAVGLFGPDYQGFIANAATIKEVQEALTQHVADAGFPLADWGSKDIDGKSGPRTRNVIAWWQASHDLPRTDGVLDKPTYDSILGHDMSTGLASIGLPFDLGSASEKLLAGVDAVKQSTAAKWTIGAGLVLAVVAIVSWIRNKGA